MSSPDRWPPLGVSVTLLGLYVVQGFSFALANGSLPVLLATRASFSLLALLNLVSVPYTLKGLLAPLLDVYFFPSLGRRKSWIIPCTLLSGAVLSLLSQFIESLVQTGSVRTISSALFAAVLCLAAQDVAVDAWATELLPRRHLAFASVFQTLGMSLGNLVGHPLLLLATQTTSSPFTLRHALLGGGLAHLAVAVAAALASDPSESRRPSLREVCASMGRVCTARQTALVAGMCAIQRVGVAVLDGCAEIYYMRLPGAEAEQARLWRNVGRGREAGWGDELRESDGT